MKESIILSRRSKRSTESRSDLSSLFKFELLKNKPGNTHRI